MPDLETMAAEQGPEACYAHLAARWDDADDDEKCGLFDLADGLYWHCQGNHAGQNSTNYRVLSRLVAEMQYSPGSMATGPATEQGEAIMAAFASWEG